MYTIRKSFTVEYSHQLNHAYTKACQDTIHGHSGLVEIFIKSPVLFEDGMVIDFTKVKDILKDSVMKYDHALILSSDSIYHTTGMIQDIRDTNENLIILQGNPTAENMARIICEEIREKLDFNWEHSRQVKLAVAFHETATGMALYEED